MGLRLTQGYTAFKWLVPKATMDPQWTQNCVILLHQLFLWLLKVKVHLVQAPTLDCKTRMSLFDRLDALRPIGGKGPAKSMQVISETISIS